MGRGAAVFGDNCATEGPLKGPPATGKRHQAEVRADASGGPVTFAKEAIAGLRPASSGPIDHYNCR